MNLRFDTKTFWKCIFIGFYLLIEGLVLQRSKAILLLNKEPVTMSFLIEVSIFYFLTGFMFALVYFIIKDALPGKKRYMRGLFYGLLVAFGVGFGLIIGIIGLDFEGKFNLMTPYKIEAYLITVVDLINFIISGMVLGVIADKKEIKSNQAKFNKKRLMIASAAGLIAYPAINFLISILIEPAISLILDIPKDAVTWFYVGFFIPLAVNGAVIPLFYCLTKEAFTGSWLQEIPTVLSDILFRVSRNPLFIRIAFWLFIASSSSLPDHSSCSYIFNYWSDCKTSKLIKYKMETVLHLEYVIQKTARTIRLVLHSGFSSVSGFILGLSCLSI